jgi:hypothetical protein
MDEEMRARLPEAARNALERTERIADSLVGQSEQRAVEDCEAQGITVRIAGRDGEAFPLQADMQFSRVNLVINAGIVTQAAAS